MISIDTKKKELIGLYKNGGSDYRPEGCPDKVNEHDFADKELGKAIPYGVYDIAANAGCVGVGIDNDTAQFSVNSIRRWLELMGRERAHGSDRRFPVCPCRRRPLVVKIADLRAIRNALPTTALKKRCCSSNSQLGREAAGDHPLR